MSLPRKDIRTYLDSDIHEALSHIADLEHLELQEFVERELVRIVRSKLHEASELHRLTAHLGLTRNQPELPGMPAKRGR